MRAAWPTGSRCEDDGFHERVRQGYLELARRFDRIVVLDGSESPEHLIAQALQIIVRRRYTIAL